MVLRIYLDTQDYAVLYKNRNEQEQRIYDFLVKNVVSGKIEIGFSYPIISEFLQDFDPNHREDRIQRAKLIKSLCGKNAFKFISRLKNEEPFSYKGDWIPNIGRVLSFDDLTLTFLDEIKNAIPTLTRSQRNALKNKRRLIGVIKENMHLIDSTVDYQKLGIPVSKKFIEDNMLLRFMAGELPRQVVEEEFLSIVTDVELFVSAWFEYGNKGSMLYENIITLGKSLELAISKMREFMIATHKQKKALKELESTIRKEGQIGSFGDELNELKRRQPIFPTIDQNWLKELIDNPEVQNFFPESFWNSLICYVKQSIKTPEKIKVSDFGDLFHSTYIPYCDLWRGDKDFSNTLICGNLPGKEKIVPRLADLPARIEQGLTD